MAKMIFTFSKMSYCYSKTVVLVCLFIQGLAYTQENYQIENSDLKDLSFEELTNLELSTDIQSDVERLNSILDYHIRKAKQESNEYQLLSVYDWRIWSEPLERAKLYSDSAIRLTYQLKDPIARAESLISFGTYLYLHDEASNALKTVITSYYLSDSLEFNEGVVNSLNIISGIQREYGQEFKALESQLKSLDILESKSGEFENYKETLLYTLDATSKCHLNVGEIESALAYAYRGKKLAKELQIKSFLNSFDVIIGQAFYYNRSYKNAIEILSNIDSQNNALTLSDIYFYIGSGELKMNNHSKAISYFEKVDSILIKNNYPLIDNVEILYQELLNHAIDKNERDKEKQYLNSLIYYDSLKKSIDLEVEKISLIDFQLPKDEEIPASNSPLLGIVILISICLGLFITIKKSSSPNEKHTALTKRSISNQIPQTIKNRLLLELKDWEAQKGFLDQDISQVELANKLGTNSSYLSRLINETFNISYSKYIKDLRTEYMVNDLIINHKQLRKKSMIQLAEMYGFKSQDSFVRAYKERTGLTPSAFLKNKKPN